jgi:hypothetical protein
MNNFRRHGVEDELEQTTAFNERPGVGLLRFVTRCVF